MILFPNPTCAHTGPATWSKSLSMDATSNIARSSLLLFVISKINEAGGLQVFLVSYTMVFDVMLFSTNVSKSTSGRLYWPVSRILGRTHEQISIYKHCRYSGVGRWRNVATNAANALTNPFACLAFVSNAMLVKNSRKTQYPKVPQTSTNNIHFESLRIFLGPPLRLTAEKPSNTTTKLKNASSAKIAAEQTDNKCQKSVCDRFSSLCSIVFALRMA